MQDFALEPLLTQVGQDFQRCSQGIALAGGQKVVPLGTAGQHLRQQGLENALRPAGADVDQVQGMRAEIGKIGPAEYEIPLREDALEERVGQTGDGGLVVEAGRDGIDGDAQLHSCPGGVQRELVV